MNDRGQYGPNGSRSEPPWALHRGTDATLLGAESQEAPWWKIWAITLFGVGVFAASRASDAVTSSANARWARGEDRSWRKWLKTSPEERRKWPEERAAWNAWEFEAQRIDAAAEKADTAAEKAARKRST